ncbi:hypothetical protein JMN32_17310 [Fulvivirga sp. 29W222]|uniref:Uncharacterized protein n=1 Tax=Fulvivirga marina TaxID=2494733 RepID=A0A937G156_9BACT|nr:hypothetical protein [Fulvivirga marina]MBL6448080.1 hypothetical protein [Fulvivirga marina]
MKKIKMSAFACSLMLTFLTGRAQEYAVSARTSYMLWQEEQRKIILLHMHLTESERMAFWPVYSDYQQAIEDLEIEYLQIIELQSEYGGELKESHKMRLYTELLEIDVELAKLRKYYYKRIRAVLSSSRAIEFMRLDYAMWTLFRIENRKDKLALKFEKDIPEQPLGKGDFVIYQGGDYGNKDHVVR